MDSVHLPAEPLVVIQPSNRWSILSLKDIWAYRELLFFLTWRDVKVRYKQTALGAAWAILQPLFMMIIFTIFFGRLAGVASAGIPYPLFALAGLVPWTFFSNAITASGNSLVGSANLITKVYFPRLIVPAAAMLAGLVDFLLAFLMLVILMIYYRVGLGPWAVMVPVFLFLLVLFTLGFTMATSASNVFYRDVSPVVQIALQLWLYLTPVAYPLAVVPERFRLFFVMNPLSAIVEGFRSAVVFNRAPDWTLTLISASIIAAVFVSAAIMFKRMDKYFADVI